MYEYQKQLMEDFSSDEKVMISTARRTGSRLIEHLVSLPGLPHLMIDPGWARVQEVTCPRERCLKQVEGWQDVTQSSPNMVSAAMILAEQFLLEDVLS